jgi:hypothetical protein
MTRPWFRLPLVLALLSPLGAAAQTSTRLELRSLNGVSRVITAADLEGLPRHEVHASAHRVTGRYAGVALGDVLRLVGRAVGDSLRGARVADYVLVEAADGYRVVFALAELDTSFTDRTVLLADRKDGVPLAANEGPFRIVVPGERRPARWVRQVTRISVIAAGPPAGAHRR